jgi:hypothetical protein
MGCGDMSRARQEKDRDIYARFLLASNSKLSLQEKFDEVDQLLTKKWQETTRKNNIKPFSNMEWNDLNNKDFETLNKKLSECEKVHLASIQASDSELIALFNAIENNTTVTAFTLYITTIANKVMNVMIKAFEINESLKKIQISTDNVTEGTWNNLKTTLKDKGYEVGSRIKNESTKIHSIEAIRYMG